MDFDFKDTGTGPVLLFLPGSYSHYAAWKGIQNALKGSYRMISTSLPGYGGSKEIRSDAVQDMSLMSNFVADVISHVDEPVHLIGHSYGGTVSFAATLSEKVSPLSLITFEGNPIFSRLEDGEFAWKTSTLDMTQRFEAAYASNDQDAAGIIIDYWSKPGVYHSLPQRFQDYCQSSVFTNLLDWRSAAGFTPCFSEYSAINVPCTLVRGEFANQAIVDISDKILREIPNCSLHVVEGSNHFLVSTHPEDCAKIIDDHMTEYAACHDNEENDA